MKRFSVKLKLTLWITLLMLLLTTSVLVFMVAVSSSVVSENAYEQLTNTVRQLRSWVSRRTTRVTTQTGLMRSSS